MGLELLSAKDELDFSDKAKLGESLKRAIGHVQKDLLAVAGLTGANGDAIQLAAADLKELHGKVDAALKKAAQAETILEALQAAKDPLTEATRRELKGLRSLSLGLTKRYDPNGFEFGKKDPDSKWIPAAFAKRPGQFALLMATEEELSTLDDVERRIVARWRVLHDTLSVCDTLMCAGKRHELEAYMQSGGVKGLSLWGQYDELTKHIRLFMDTADSGQGAEWVPTGVGSLVLGEVYPDFALVSMLPQVPMPRSPYLYTVEPPLFYAKKSREATDDTPANNRNLPPRDLDTRNVTFTAQKLAGIIRHSSEIEEDTIVELASRIRFGLGLSVEASKESCWVNGQASAISGTASSFDTGETFDDGSSTLLEDQRVCWDGLRYYRSLTGVTEDASTGLVADHTFSLRSKLGRFGKSRADTLWVTGYIGEARCLAIKDGNGNPVVLTADKAGGAGTFETGVIGRMAGSPLYISNEMPENLNAAGVADGGGGNYTEILLFNRTRFLHGQVRMTRIEATREGGSAFEQDAIYAKATWRGVGKASVTPSASEKSIGSIVGVR